MVSLSEVLTQYQEYIDVPEPKIYPKLSVKLYGKGVMLDEPADGTSLKMKRHQIAKSGQVILSEIWGKKGAIGFVPSEGEGALCTSHFFLFDVHYDKIEPRYLQAIFTANYLQSQLDAEAKGTTGYAAVRPKHLLAAKIPLPPLDEQRRIVARIEALAAKIKEARGLRQQAVEGANALWATCASKILGQFVESPSKALSDICEIRGGLQKSPARVPHSNPIPYITVAHVQRNRIDKSVPPRFFEVSPAELERWRLKNGDLLIIEGNGSAEQIGRVALFRGEIENCVHQNHVIRARPNQSLAIPEYLNAYMNSPLGQEEVRRRSRTTSGLLTLSLGRASSIEIPLPSPSDQRRIVGYLDGLQAQVDALKRLQAATSAELDALLPSVLDKAFNGEL